ncbi:MAG TPA: hypothetical protein VJR48_05470 [Ktedonobacterales bacterium]|nr:hypothetical protein [Ktedonobacterales bacterium]
MEMRAGRRWGRVWLPLPLLFAALAVGLLAGCGGGQAQQPGAPLAASTTTMTTGATTTPSGPPAPTPVAITDLTTFRQKLAAAVSSNNWAQVAPLLSPDFSFQGPTSGGARLIMPGAGQDFKGYYKGAGGWSQAADWEVSVHYCFAGNLPANQQMGFDAGDGVFMLAGIEKWQGYWVLAWAFIDSMGGGNACMSGGGPD